MLSNHQQIGLRLGSGDTGHGTHFGVTDYAFLERGPDKGHRCQGIGNPYFLPRRAEANAAFPVEPMGAGATPRIGPPFKGIELRDEGQETERSGVDMGGKSSDICFKSGELVVARMHVLGTFMGTLINYINIQLL